MVCGGHWFVGLQNSARNVWWEINKYCVGGKVGCLCGGKMGLIKFERNLKNELMIIINQIHYNNNNSNPKKGVKLMNFLEKKLMN